MTETNTETEQQPTPTPVPDYASEGIPTETRPMMPANPVNAPDPDDEIFGSGREGITEAAEKLTQRRNPDKREWQAKTPLPVEYLDVQSGVKKAPAETISPEQAAHDLGNFRRTLAEQELDAAEKAAVQQLDVDVMAAEVQAAVDKPPPSEAPQPQPQEQPQQQQPEPALEGDNIWQDPRVIAGVTEYTNQVAGAFQQAEAKFAADLQANAAAATASIFAAVPELQGLQTTEQLQTALAVIERQNPERGQQIRAHIANISQLAAKSQEFQQQQVQAQVQQYRQQFDHVAKQADDAYDKWISQQEPDAGRRQEIAATAHQMLRDSGLSDQDVAYHWQTSPILRSFAGQQILADAARYRMSRQGVKTKMQNPVPIVQRPGSPASIAPDADYQVGKLSAELDRVKSAKAGAALLSARRARR